MKVGILTNEYPPFIFGGIGSFSEQLAEGLVELGVPVKIIAGWPRNTSMRVLQRGVELVWLPRGRIAPNQLWFQLRNSNAIQRELMDCDILHGQDSSVYPLLELWKRRGFDTPAAVTVHTNPKEELRQTIQSVGRGGSLTDFGTYVAGFPLWDMTIREHSKCADRLVSVSSSLRSELCNDYGIRRRIDVIHNSVSPQKLTSQETVSYSRVLPESKVQLICAGRLYYRKGVLRLIEIVRDMVHRKDTNRFRLDIFGSGPLESLLRSRLRALDLEGLVEIHGFVERRTLVAAMLAADIFCVPSRYEACPMVLMEGMALGKPVIAFNLPFSVEFLRGYEALLASSEADYADKLSFLIKSRPERIALGSKLKERAKNFSPTKMAEAYKTIYEELIRR